MHKHIAITFLCLTIAGNWTSYSGEVDFRNAGLIFETPADRLVYRDRVGGVKLVGTNYVAGLWFTAGDDPASVDGRISPDRGRQAGQAFKFRLPTTTMPGTWSSGAGVSPYFNLEGVNVGEQAMLQVRVWDSLKFTTFQEAFAGLEFGASEPFPYTVPDYSQPPSARAMNNLRAFSMTVDPRSLSVGDVVVGEGSNGVAQANFTVSLAQAQTEPVSVNFATEDGTALAGQDYVAASGTLTFAPGELTKAVSVTVTADAPHELDELFYLRLSNPANGVLAKPLASCTITELAISGLSIDTSVSFHTLLNRRYVVERSNNAIDWEPVPGATNVLGIGGETVVVDRGSGCQPMRAYRTRLLE